MGAGICQLEANATSLKPIQAFTFYNHKVFQETKGLENNQQELATIRQTLNERSSSQAMIREKPPGQSNIFIV
jgi:hypothetical protein